MRAALILSLLLALPAGATSPTKVEIREAQRQQVACFIARFFGRRCERPYP
jgi:hypothetical protein